MHCVKGEQQQQQQQQPDCYQQCARQASRCLTSSSESISLINRIVAQRVSPVHQYRLSLASRCDRSIEMLFYEPGTANFANLFQWIYRHMTTSAGHGSGQPVLVGWSITVSIGARCYAIAMTVWSTELLVQISGVQKAKCFKERYGSILVHLHWGMIFFWVAILTSRLPRNRWQGL